ncbi:hypothetical protein SBA2_140015 [Acidobacteriia bacterium SbA2]|nr:hypothetical protein SBA2_140015 [Acidobacteriia bacterium SbA2]
MFFLDFSFYRTNQASESQSVNASAFLGTNPADEPITSGLLVTRTSETNRTSEQATSPPLFRLSSRRRCYFAPPWRQREARLPGHV